MIKKRFNWNWTWFVDIHTKAVALMYVLIYEPFIITQEFF